MDVITEPVRFKIGFFFLTLTPLLSVPPVLQGKRNPRYSGINDIKDVILSPIKGLSCVSYTGPDMEWTGKLLVQSIKMKMLIS